MQEKFSRILIGNDLKSIRTEQKIPIKKVAQNMDVSEATISQFETGKNKPTNEKIALFTEICGQSFNFDLDRNLIMDRVYDIYDLYTDLKKEELNKTIQIVKDTHNIACSYARFEYYLILYMDAIINQKEVDTALYKGIIELGKNNFSVRELSIYYDIMTLEKIYSNEIKEALGYLDKALSNKGNHLMINYHYCSIYLDLGYFNLSQQYIHKSLKMAIQQLSFDRLYYLLLNQGVLYMYTSRYDEANELFLKLLNESIKRQNEIMKYCILSNLVFTSLIQKDIKRGFDYLNRIDEQFTDDLDLKMYKCLLYYFDHEYTKSKECIASFLRDVKNSKYHENFIRALKYMMDNKPLKAIDNFETCYQIALKNGQYDRAIFVLKQLNELYLDHGLQNKLKKVKELQENFYKMSYANQIIEDIELKLN